MKANRFFFWQIAARNLKHGGQRAVLAILCIIFGVMSLVAMNTVANNLRTVLLVSGREILGGDFGIYPLNDRVFNEKHKADFQDMLNKGQIEAFTMIDSSRDIIFKTENDPVWHYPGNGLGIDTKTYPVAGNFKTTDGRVERVGALLEKENTALITADIAENFKIQTGDQITLTDTNIGKPVKVTVTGILIDTPNHEGNKLYYSYQVARELGNGELRLGSIMIKGGNEMMFREYSESNEAWLWSAEGNLESRRDRDSTLRLMLNAAGGLGLLVGGIGVANTMTVLISRRRKQIATWKLLGYENKHIRAIFLTEALMIGAIGSLIGSGLGVLLSKTLTRLFQRTASWLLIWKPDFGSALIGLGAGILTALLFALWAVLRTSNVSPVSVIRTEELKMEKSSLGKSIGLMIVMGFVFLMMISAIIGSLKDGLKYMGIAIVTLILVCFFIAAGIWLLTALLPVKRIPRLLLTRQHLRRDGITPIMAGAALFVGVLTFLFAVLAIESSKIYQVNFGEVWKGPNLIILAPADQEETIRKSVVKLNPIDANFGYKVRFKSISPTVDVDYLVLSREKPMDYTTQSSAFAASKGFFIMDGSYYKRDDGDHEHIEADGNGNLNKGFPIEIEFLDGQKIETEIVGTYEESYSLPTRGSYFSPLLMNNEALKAITTPEQVQFFLTLSPEELKNVPQELAGLDESALVLNVYDWLNRDNQNNKNLLVLAAAMAALAFSAGIVLIANSVSLAILNRRYEIGVLKCVGYSQGKIMSGLILEYWIVGFTSFFAGLAVTQVFLYIVRHSNEIAMRVLKLPPSAIAITALIILGLTALSVILVAWKPIQVSPTVVLADRD